MKSSVMGRITRKHIIITIAAAVALALGYIVWSTWLWNQYDSTVDARLSSAEQAVVSVRSVSDTQASVNVKKLRAASGQLGELVGVCRPHWSVSWQTILPAQRESVNNCDQSAAKYAKTKSAIDATVAYLDMEQQVLGVLSGLKSIKKLTDKTWDDAIGLWESAASDLKQLQASEEYQPVLATLRAQIQEVIEAWQQLKKADKAEKRIGYESAYDKLDQAIRGMVDVADKSDEVLQGLLKNIEATQS